MPTTAEIYTYAQLATASYVRMGDQPLPLRTDGATFAREANSQASGRLPTSVATALFNPPSGPQWNILDYYGGDVPSVQDKSGFAATLFEQGGQKVLAMRGTEPSLDGGVDVLSADLGQIGIIGLALTQVVSMANYIMRLRGAAGDLVPQVKVEATFLYPDTQPHIELQGATGVSVYVRFSSPTWATGLGKLNLGDSVSLTGHSLGGHLAVMAAKLFPDLFDPKVVIFNAAGYDPTTANLVDLLDRLTPLPTDVFAQSLKSAIAAEIGLAATTLATHGNRRTDQALERIFGLLMPGQQPVLGAPQVVALVSEDVNPIEDSDNIASPLTGADKYGTPVQVITEANSHVIEPFMDALGLHALMASTSASLTIADTGTILGASSANAIDSEESLLVALYKVTKGQAIVLPVSDASKGFLGYIGVGKGDIGSRDAYHSRLLEIQSSFAANSSWTVTSLVGMQAAELAARAEASNGFAYRYSLKELNPFAVLGPDSIYLDPAEGGSAHNVRGALEVYVSNDATLAGMTSQYIADRAQMLRFVAAANMADNTILASSEVAGHVLYQDLTKRQVVQESAGRPTQLLVFAPGSTPPANLPVIVFGSDASDELRGRGGADRLYGGLGSDLLTGGKANDYLEGGAGMDVYAYSAETNALSQNTNDGDDELRDTDGRGLIRYTFTGSGIGATTTSRVIGGAAIKVTGTQWRSADGKFVYDRQGSDLLVTIQGDAGGSLMIRGFNFDQAQAGGYLGIRLIDGLAAPGGFARSFLGDKQDWDSDPNQSGVQTQTDAFGNVVRADGQEGRPDVEQAGRADTFYGSAADETERFATGGGDDVVYGDGPSSYSSSVGGNDLIETGAGRDIVTAGAGNDWVEGGAGGDILGGNLGNDTLVGDTSAGQTWTLEQAIEFGEFDGQGAGPGDVLSGDAGDDVVLGGTTADLIYGGEGADVIVAGAGADNIYGDGAVTSASLDWTATRTVTAIEPTRIYILSTPGVVASNALDQGAGDTIYGGAGEDWIFAGAGDDYVEGGADDDVVFGEAGSDILIGGGGKDSLHGDSASVDAADLSGDDYLDGGAGDDSAYTGDGYNIIAYNQGGGFDSVYSGSGAHNTLSLGGGLDYADLSLSRDGDDLIVNTGGDNKIAFKDWYAGNATLERLQIVLDEDYDAGSADALYNRRVQSFDFLELVSQFDAALLASPGLSSWALTNALLEAHLASSDEQALGGDLAYWYGRNGALTGISLQAAQQVIGAAGFGSDAQTLRPFSGLQEGLVKLS